MAKTKRGFTKKCKRLGPHPREHKQFTGPNGQLMAAAASQAFDIPELLQNIFSYFPDSIILTTFQRVCQRWRGAARGMLRVLLDGYPRPHSGQPSRRIVNHFLLEHFKPLFTDGKNKGWPYTKHLSLRVFDMPIAQTPGTRAQHEAYARRDASWRDMQIFNPPVHELRFRRHENSHVEILRFPEGVRMGPIYDLFVAIATKGHHKTRWHPQLLWPITAPSATPEGYKIAVGDGDYIYIIQTEMPTPVGCCFNIHRKVSGTRCADPTAMDVRYTRSRMWLVKCDGVEDDNLVVQLGGYERTRPSVSSYKTWW